MQRGDVTCGKRPLPRGEERERAGLETWPVGRLYVTTFGDAHRAHASRGDQKFVPQRPWVSDGKGTKYLKANWKAAKRSGHYGGPRSRTNWRITALREKAETL